MTLPFTWRTLSQKWFKFGTCSSRQFSSNKMSKPKRHMIHSPITVTFLGTASAVPSRTRNHSALTLRLASDLWLFDCGEATQHQLQKSTLRMGSIEKIFITHTHGDHIFGLVPLMCGLLDGSGGTAEGIEDPRAVNPNTPPLEIYGPLGTRAYVRSCLKYTQATLGASYVVHELRTDKDPHGDYTALVPHRHERPGRDIRQDADGLWRNVFSDSEVSVSAAPIRHSCQCIGYVVTEAPIPSRIDPSQYVPHLTRTGSSMRLMKELQKGARVTLNDGTVLEGPPLRQGRKVVVLGDTCDPSGITPLAMDADLLIHEATNAHLPHVDPGTNAEDTYATVHKRAKSRGHSTPQMAGSFAKSINAKHLILNHFSARYPGDDDTDPDAAKIMQTIARLAENEFGKEVICARDLLEYNVKVENSDN